MEAERAPEFLSLAEAREELSMPIATFRRRMRKRAVPTYRDGADERRFLMRREDLQLLTQPRPASPVKEKAAA